MKRHLLHFILILHITVNNVGAQIEPYLSTPTSTSIWVSWKTTSETETKVEYGLTPDDLGNIATGTFESLADDYKWHTVKLTGLTPDTRYYYRTVSGVQVSKIQRFRSHPQEGADTGHYRFAIIGDHQVLDDDRYERLVQACKDKVIEKYATSASDTLIEDHLRMLVCDGDQVNVGTLEHYEKMHFGQSRPLMSNIPIMTVVGNHEYGSDPNLKNYFGHYVYDDISYKGIVGSHGEEYYAFQVANVLFVMINSNRGTDPDQYSWIDQIVQEADSDSTVEWVFAVNHHCFYNEQMPGDGIEATRNGYGPRLANTDKYTMHITGHAHLYARGSLRNHPCHVIINGGGSHDQYWGQTTYVDYQDVQKTIERQIFQIVDIDLDNREMHVETYSNGTSLFPGFTEDVLIDDYSMNLDAPIPNKPSIQNTATDTISLPYTFEGSEYSGQEPFNSIEYQVAHEDVSFDYPEYTYKTDYENIFLSSGSPDYIPIDQNEGVDITKMKLESSNILPGLKYFRFRYRDQSMHWSHWSDTVSFTILSDNPDSIPTQNKCPVLRYKLQEDAYEFLNGSLNGTPNNGVTFTTDPKRGQVADFNNNGMITISNGNTQNLLLPTASISVSCWVRLNSYDLWGGFVGIFQDNGSYEKGWVLGTRSDNFSFALSTGSSLNYLEVDSSLKTGEWYHVVGTYNGYVQRIYINGELRGSATIKGEIEYPPSGWFQIGAYKDNNESFGHDGEIADVIIWERAITLNDVRNLYKNTVPPCSNFIADNTEVTEGGQVQFSDLTQFAPQYWNWYFEGGEPETSSNQNPTINYNQPGIYNVRLMSGNTFGSDSLFKEMYINVGTVGIDQVEFNPGLFKIYPNPARNKITIEINDPDFMGSQLTIQNVMGNKLYSQKISLNSNTETVDISNLPTGIYFLRLINDNKNSVFKSFIVK